jgi:acetyltransferase-like isoleucine patch superfamily enzyme
MFKKINRYIRKKIVKLLSTYFGEVQIEYQKNELRKLSIQFNKVGERFGIEQPFIIKNISNITIGYNFYASHNLRLEPILKRGIQNFSPLIIIGNNVSIQSNCHIGAIGKIIIEDDVMIASNVYISDHFHGEIKSEELVIPPSERLLTSRGEVRICKNVWIGDSVCILPGVSIGENTIVGANSVVTKSFPANVVIAGVPAKIIKVLK